MSLIYFTRRVHQAGSVVSEQGLRFSRSLYTAASRVALSVGKTTSAIHISALRRVSNKAYDQHSREATAYHLLCREHSNIEQHLARVRAAKLETCIRVRKRAAAIALAVKIELKQLGKE